MSEYEFEFVVELRQDADKSPQKMIFAKVKSGNELQARRGVIRKYQKDGWYVKKILRVHFNTTPAGK